MIVECILFECVQKITISLMHCYTSKRYIYIVLKIKCLHIAVINGAGVLLSICSWLCTNLGSSSALSLDRSPFMFNPPLAPGGSRFLLPFMGPLQQQEFWIDARQLFFKIGFTSEIHVRGSFFKKTRQKSYLRFGERAFITKLQVAEYPPYSFCK